MSAPNKTYNKKELDTKLSELNTLLLYFETFNTQAQETDLRADEKVEQDDLMEYLGYQVVLSENISSLKANTVSMQTAIEGLFTLAVKNKKVKIIKTENESNQP